MRRILVIMAAILLSVGAGAQSINPSQIKSGTFQNGTYTFPSALTARTMIPGANAIYSAKADGSAPTLHAAGTSIVYGYGLTSQAQAYPNLVAAALGWNIDNRAISGSQCVHMMGTYGSGTFQPEFDYTTPITTDSVWLMAPADNNSHVDTLDAASLEQYRGCMAAGVAFAGLPNNQWIRPQINGVLTAQECSESGTWGGNFLINGAPGRASSVTGSTLTCSLPAGQSVYVVAFKQNTGNTSPKVKYSVSVDGVLVVDPVSGTTTFDTYSSVTNWLYPYAIRVGGLAKVPHTVVVTVIAGDGGDPLIIYGMASVSPSSFSAGGPRVIYPSPIQYTSAGYASNTTSAVAKATYANVEDSMIHQMAADGFQARRVDLMNNVAYDPASGASSDGVHPNAAGQQTIANAVLAAISSASVPRLDNAFVRADVDNKFEQPQTFYVPTGTTSFALKIVNGLDQYNIFVNGASPVVGSWPAHSLAIESGAGGASGVVLGPSSVQLQVARNAVATADASGFGVNASVASDGGGHKHIRVLACTTSATVGDYCDTPITWTTPFADASYTLVCNLAGSGGNATSSLAAYAQTANGFSARITNITANAVGGYINCIADHD